MHRHPKVCKYWKEDNKGYRRDQAYKYLYQYRQLSNGMNSKEDEKVPANVDQHRVVESEETWETVIQLKGFQNLKP